MRSIKNVSLLCEIKAKARESTYADNSSHQTTVIGRRKGRMRVMILMSVAVVVLQRTGRGNQGSAKLTEKHVSRGAVVVV